MKQTDLEKIINFDFQNWPEFKLNLRDILIQLGAKFNKETNNWEIPESRDLDIFPRRLIDDGMGYGVDEEYIVDVGFVNDPTQKYCNIFTTPSLSKDELNRKFIELNLIYDK